MARRFLDQAEHLLTRGIVDDRAHLDLRIKAGTNRHRPHRPSQHGGELLGDFCIGIEAVRRDTGLPGVAHLGDHRPLQRGIEVGVVEHDEGRVAAELHRAADDVFGGLGEQDAPDLG